MNFIMYADGSTLLSICEKIRVNIFEANKIAQTLIHNDLIEKIEH